MALDLSYISAIALTDSGSSASIPGTPLRRNALHSRPLRIEFPGTYYYVMNRGLSRQPIFRTDKDRKAFLDLLGDVHGRWGLLLYTGVYFSQPLGRPRGLEWNQFVREKIGRIRELLGYG